MRLISSNTHPSLWTLILVWFVPRSPWSNEYDPPLDDGTVPSVKLRKLEIAANEAFDTYREMYAFLRPTRLCFRSNQTPRFTFVIFRYYEGGISSVYLWDLDDGGFAGVVLFKKGEPGGTVSSCCLVSNPPYSTDASQTYRERGFLGFHPRIRSV